MGWERTEAEATLLSWQHRQTQPCRTVNTAVFESLPKPRPRGPPGQTGVKTAEPGSLRFPRRACPRVPGSSQGRTGAGLGPPFGGRPPLPSEQTEGSRSCRAPPATDEAEGCSLGTGSAGAVGAEEMPCPRIVPGKPGLITSTGGLARHGPAPILPWEGQGWQEADPSGWLEMGGLGILPPRSSASSFILTRSPASPSSQLSCPPPARLPAHTARCSPSSSPRFFPPPHVPSVALFARPPAPSLCLNRY